MNKSEITDVVDKLVLDADNIAFLCSMLQDNLMSGWFESNPKLCKKIAVALSTLADAHKARLEMFKDIALIETN